jgi:hypothetical protein
MRLLFYRCNQIARIRACAKRQVKYPQRGCTRVYVPDTSAGSDKGDFAGRYPGGPLSRLTAINETSWGGITALHQRRAPVSIDHPSPPGWCLYP